MNKHSEESTHHLKYSGGFGTLLSDTSAVNFPAVLDPLPMFDPQLGLQP